MAGVGFRILAFFGGDGGRPGEAVREVNLAKGGESDQEEADTHMENVRDAQRPRNQPLFGFSPPLAI